MTRVVQVALAIIVIVGGGLAGRMLLGARAEYNRANVAATQGNIRDQARYFRRAMAFYMPLNPWSARAKDHLLAFAREADRQGDRQRAFALWTELRSAILALRGFYQPFAADLPEIHARLAVLSTPAAAGSNDALRERFDHPPDPHRGWVLLGLLGFILWIAALITGIFQGFIWDLKRTGRLNRWVWLSAVGFFMFCLGMTFA